MIIIETMIYIYAINCIMTSVSFFFIFYSIHELINILYQNYSGWTTADYGSAVGTYFRRIGNTMLGEDSNNREE